MSVISSVETIQLFVCWHTLHSSTSPPHHLFGWPRDLQGCLTFQKVKRHSWNIQLTWGEKQLKSYRVIFYQDCCRVPARLQARFLCHCQTNIFSKHTDICCSCHHFFCIILPVSVLGTELLSEMDFGSKLFLRRSALSWGLCADSYNVQWSRAV